MRKEEEIDVTNTQAPTIKPLPQEHTVYMVGKHNVTIRVKYHVTNAGTANAVASAKKYTYKSNYIGRVGSLDSLIQEFNDMAEEGLFDGGLAKPIQVFVNQKLANNIQEGTYKFWLMTGTYYAGGAVPVEELRLWEEFQNFMDVYGHYICIKDNMTATIPPKPSPNYKITPEKKLHDKYIRDMWDALGKMQIETGPTLEDEDAQQGSSSDEIPV